ncbi:hypothetical protein C3B59_17360 [Cryobacterium zongtaii]|uniref:Uncharacterized protein n=1 Tax=Cryobacterium zongtaii TaxID=1259217 RepID=A0A2S3Z612_9MICO|nr:hypothetical protein [Cryobacterium zongtaii]POH59660.1 hypothetical protein C3B59_17360 [Cryobacterium zongtaii]
MDVIAAADGGLALIRNDRAEVVPPARLRLDDGVTVWIDPLDPPTPWRIDVGEPDAGPVIEELLGIEAAEQTRQSYWALLRGDDPAGRIEPGGRTPAWSAANRLGFLLWLEQNAVTPLAQADLDLEIATVAARLGDLGALEIARERFARAGPQLRRLAVAVRDGAEVPRISGFVAEALGAYITLSATDLPEPVIEDLEAMQSVAARIAASEESGSTAIGDDVLNGLLDVFERSGTARSSGPGEAVRRFSVDWENVPRGVLDPGEDTIAARWDASGSQLSVSVVAGRARPQSDLLFRLQRGDGDRPSAGGALLLDAETGTYQGSCKLDAPMGQNDRIDVVTVEWTNPVALGAAAERRRAQRSVAWAISFERFAVVDGKVSPSALGAAQRAWFDAADRLATMDAPAAARCSARARGIDRATADPEAWVFGMLGATLAELLLDVERTSI